MPRQAYNADLRAVIDSEDNPLGVSAIRRGDDDGFIDFTFAPPSGGSFPVTAMVSDVSDYPSSHTYFLVVDDSTPPEFSSLLARASDCLQSGLSIQDLLGHVSGFFYGASDGSIADVEDTEATDDEEDDGFGEDPSFFDFDNDDDPSQHFKPSASSASSLSLEARNRIRQDLRLVKQAGFKVGASPSLLLGQPTYLSVSCKVKRLGISGEAMQAWGIAPEEYLILLIQYPQGYKAIVGAQKAGVPPNGSMVFRTGIGYSYKPSVNDICRAFSSTFSADQTEQNTSSFRKLFISEAMHHLLNDTFLTLFRCRLLGMSWDGATLFNHDKQSAGLSTESLVSHKNPKYQREVAPNSAFPRVVTADHVNDHDADSGLSLPLVAMQFFVRNFVRSPDYCLICHRRMPDGLEALKPYVCDIPLCLFQYMQMGLGPRIEHEIMTQQRVVDLLVTLCYCSAKTNSLDSTHLPKGLGLRIPPVEVLRLGQMECSSVKGGEWTIIARENPGEPPVRSEGRTVRVNLDHLDMTFSAATSRSDLGVKKGDWIAFKIASCPYIHHVKVEDISNYPMIRFANPIVMPATALESSSFPGNPAITLQVPLPTGSHDAIAWLYTTECDSLDEQDMRESVWLLLEMLPGVEEMKHHIKQSGSDLKSFSHRIPTPVLGMLRWIIASNRACIMQIDAREDSGGVADTGRHDAVHGMPGWMQFKFAMGAPDKERRFLQSVESVKADMKLQIPTLFAWHGSALQNWHSIIRDGLNFSRVVNGRAYGDGIYFARDSSTSTSYSSKMGTVTGFWPLSKVKPSVILSLSEVVNAPSKFRSSTPYYVVQHLDWTQTRYLFVRGLSQDAFDKAKDVAIPTYATPQDPAVTPTGSIGKHLVIPASKMSRNANHAVSVGHKRFKAEGSASEPISVDDSDSSEATDDEDRELLEPEENTVQASTLMAQPQTSSLADFVPGTLDRSKLPTMTPPTGDAASVMATKRLQLDYRSILKLQKSSPQHELGWYIDPEVIIETGNIYQWIVELHSFDKSIPLAQDMKAHGVKSVVLEIRFGKEYPMAPPFVRVVRPRFLPFIHGGGGHVTAGGALCMELLTNDGWSSVSTIEAVLMQVRLAMSSMDPAPARLDRRGGQGEYGVGEAVQAFGRACRRHGWTIPDDILTLAKSIGILL